MDGQKKLDCTPQCLDVQVPLLMKGGDGLSVINCDHSRIFRFKMLHIDLGYQYGISCQVGPVVLIYNVYNVYIQCMYNRQISQMLQ